MELYKDIFKKWFDRYNLRKDRNINENKKYIFCLLNKNHNSLSKRDHNYIIKRKEKFEKQKNYSIGLATKLEWLNFSKKYYRDYIKYYKLLEVFVKNNKNSYIYLSNDINEKINRIKKDSKGIIFGVTSFIPEGLWFSCGISWLEMTKLHPPNLNGYRFLEIKQHPYNAYSLEISNLKLARLTNCEELYNFSVKYENKNKNKNILLDYNRIKKDFDGILICPYLGIKCNNFVKKIIEKKYKNNDDEDLYISKEDILEADFLNLINEKDKKIIWSLRWQVASGVIFKNYQKIAHKRIFDN